MYFLLTTRLIDIWSMKIMPIPCINIVYVVVMYMV